VLGLDLASTDIALRDSCLIEGDHIVSLRDRGGLRMPFAPLYRSLLCFARCLGQYHRPSMPLQAIKSEEGRYVEVRLTIRLDADSRHEGRFV
jgi:hypothetical protein